MDSAIRRVPSGFPGWIADFHVYGGFGEYEATAFQMHPQQTLSTTYVQDGRFRRA